MLIRCWSDISRRVCAGARRPAVCCVLQGTVLRYISVHTMLHIVMCTYFIRLGCYALLPFAHSPYAVLPVELLHGITFACGWGAGTINSKRVAPPELAATMQVRV